MQVQVRSAVGVNDGKYYYLCAVRKYRNEMKFSDDFNCDSLFLSPSLFRRSIEVNWRRTRLTKWNLFPSPWPRPASNGNKTWFFIQCRDHSSASRCTSVCVCNCNIAYRFWQRRSADSVQSSVVSARFNSTASCNFEIRPECGLGSFHLLTMMPLTDAIFKNY